MHQLHHLAVRDLPESRPEESAPCPIHSSPRSASFRSTSRPRGWAFCNGQLLPISQNTALFSLLGTTYGGDGKSNFALPNLQGNAPMHPGQGPGLSLHDLGETGGTDTVTLLRDRRCRFTRTRMRGLDSTIADLAMPGNPLGRWRQASAQRSTATPPRQPGRRCSRRLAARRRRACRTTTCSRT